MTHEGPKLVTLPDRPPAAVFDAQWEASIAREAAPSELVRLAFRHHHGMVFSTANRILDDRFEAEDVTQGVFEILARKLDTVRDPAKLPGFLKTCAVREALAVVKKRRWWKGRRGTLFLQSQEESAAPEAHAVASVRQILARLEPEERTALILKFVEHHSHEEVAGLMGTSVSTVRRRLDGAKKRVAAMEDVMSQRLSIELGGES
jgi:RNA polymerase sigma-70 factor (ECF subfamily)